MDDPLVDTFEHFRRLKVRMPKEGVQALRFEKNVLAVRGPAPPMTVQNDLAAAASSRQPQMGARGARLERSATPLTTISAGGKALVTTSTCR